MVEQLVVCKSGRGLHPRLEVNDSCRRKLLIYSRVLSKKKSLVLSRRLNDQSPRPQFNRPLSKYEGL